MAEPQPHAGVAAAAAAPVPLPVALETSKVVQGNVYASEHVRFTELETEKLLETVDEVLPRTKDGWASVMGRFNTWAKSAGKPLRTVAAIRSRYDRLCKGPSTGGGAPSRLQASAVAIRKKVAQAYGVETFGVSASLSEERELEAAGIEVQPSGNAAQVLAAAVSAQRSSDSVSGSSASEAERPIKRRRTTNSQALELIAKALAAPVAAAAPEAVPAPAPRTTCPPHKFSPFPDSTKILFCSRCALSVRLEPVSYSEVSKSDAPQP